MSVQQEGLKWRYAVKKFDPNFKLEEHIKDELMEALRLSPSSMGVQPYHVLAIENQDIKDRLKEASFGQTQVSDCALYIVFATGDPLKQNWIEKHAEMMVTGRNIPAEKATTYMQGFAEKLSLKPVSERSEWAIRQAYIALGNVITWCAFSRIDTCPMEGFNPDIYDEVLGLREKGLRACVAIAIGKRDPDDKYGLLPKIRRPQEEFATRIF